MKLAAWITGAYAAAAGAAFVLERTMMYPAPRERVEPRLPGGSLVRLAGTGGRTVHACFVPPAGGAPTIVHFHGNAEALADQAQLARRLRAHGLGFYAVEYPGYGLSSDARPSEAAICADAETALVHLRDRLGVASERTVLQGQSLGSGVAVEMARRGFGARLVLVSPYTSMVDMAKRMVPILPLGLIVRDRYDNAGKAPGLPLATLIVHGSDDEIIPVAMGRRLSLLFPNARLVVLEGFHHNDVWLGESLLREIVSFAGG